MNKQDAKEILMKLPYPVFSDLAHYSHEYVLAREAKDNIMFNYQSRMLIGYMHCLTSLDMMDATESDNLLVWLRGEDRATEMNTWGRCKFLWMDTKIEANKVFTITKSNRTARWKVVEHPYLDCYGLVRDYIGKYGAMTNKPCRDDEDHIVAAVDLDEAYDVAYDMT